jgi:hypothetical protein
MQSVSFLKRGGGLTSLAKADVPHLAVYSSIGFALFSFYINYGHLWKPLMCRDCRFAVMQARLSRQRLGWKPCLGESNAASAQQVASLSNRYTFGSELR